MARGSWHKIEIPSRVDFVDGAFRTIQCNRDCYSTAVLSKAKRLQMFLQRLEAAPPASSGDEALALLAETLNGVEDEFSGVPYRPELWESDRRLYPPQPDAARKFPERPSLRKYRNKGHYNFIGLNGAIRIETLDAEMLLDKPGQDGRKAFELDV